jgi:hypothetical protein
LIPVRIKTKRREINHRVNRDFSQVKERAIAKLLQKVLEPPAEPSVDHKHFGGMEWLRLTGSPHIA